MSPIATAKGGSASGDYRKESTLARLLGSGMNWLSRMNDGGWFAPLMKFPSHANINSSAFYNTSSSQHGSLFQYVQTVHSKVSIRSHEELLL
jgi:hypothetical protein